MSTEGVGIDPVPAKLRETVEELESMSDEQIEARLKVLRDRFRMAGVSFEEFSEKMKEFNRHVGESADRLKESLSSMAGSYEEDLKEIGRIPEGTGVAGAYGHPTDGGGKALSDAERARRKQARKAARQARKRSQHKK